MYYVTQSQITSVKEVSCALSLPSYAYLPYCHLLMTVIVCATLSGPLHISHYYRNLAVLQSVFCVDCQRALDHRKQCTEVVTVHCRLLYLLLSPTH